MTNGNFRPMIQGRHRRADAYDMYKLLGVKRLPVEGMPERTIQGVRVYVKPLPPGAPRHRQSLRVTAICDCGQHVPVGRMHQHICKKHWVVRRFSSDDVVGRFVTEPEAQTFVEAQIEHGGVYTIEYERRGHAQGTARRVR